MFSDTTYSVNENEGSVQPVLVLSNPSSSDITVEVYDTSISATGGSANGIVNTVVFDYLLIL